MVEPHRSYPTIWRGSTTIHTATFYTNGTWPLGVLKIEPGRIEVKSLHRRISFTPEKVIELRMFRFPFPTMEVVFCDGNGHALATFSALRYRKLKALIEDAGFKVSSEKAVYTGWDMAERSSKYGLLQTGGD